MKIAFKFIILTLAICAINSPVLYAEDCLSLALAKGDQELANFYYFIAAAYTQEHTNNALKLKDEFSFLDMNFHRTVNSPAPASLLDFVAEFFPRKGYTVEETVAWLEEIKKIQQKINSFGLLNAQGIQAIHDAATYGGPYLCKDNRMHSVDQALHEISANFAAIQTVLEQDEKYDVVQYFRQNAAKTDDKFKVGAEVELFHPDYLSLFAPFINDDRWQTWANSAQILLYSGIGKTELIADLNVILKDKGVSLIGDADYLFTGSRAIFGKLEQKFGTKDFFNHLTKPIQWAVLVSQIAIHRFVTHREMTKRMQDWNVDTPVWALEFFSTPSMLMMNYMLTLDHGGDLMQFYQESMPKIEFVHKRPYKSISAYLESLVLLAGGNRSLLDNLLCPKKQLNTTYTHHAHVSYRGNEQMAQGRLLQGTIALIMLMHGDNAFTTSNFQIRYTTHLCEDEKCLIRIRAHNQPNRIEFRRQFSWWSYVDFLNWLYGNVFTKNRATALGTIKKLNKDLLKHFEGVDIARTYDSRTATCLEHIRQQNL
ncbi:MAG TPA: hypothetical protein VEL47_00460 [Myxococcota bacterium]|nr:hypothetical protein [Myxococcota bacterium]